MPFINTKVTTEISVEKEAVLKDRLGKAMSIVGKPEAYVMMKFEDNCRMWFSSTNDRDCAFIEVSILGFAQKASYERLTSALCDIISEELNIDGDRIYVKYTETEYWGHNGYMF